MLIAHVRLSLWDKIYRLPVKDEPVVLGDRVVVKTDFGSELGTVIQVEESAAASEQTLGPKIEGEGTETFRKADYTDLKNGQEREIGKDEVLNYCREAIKKYKLPMKLVDARFPLDGGKIIFAFIAKGRVDFRELVKDLTRRFQKSVRLQQVNVREEVKFCGSIGACGRPLCCATYLQDLGNITLEKAQNQQIVHWGPDRLSGSCGRLKCCLAHEDELYKELAGKLPAIGSKIKTKGGEGEVANWHILKQTVDVRLADGSWLEVPIK